MQERVNGRVSLSLGSGREVGETKDRRKAVIFYQAGFTEYIGRVFAKS